MNKWEFFYTEKETYIGKKEILENQLENNGKHEWYQEPLPV